MGQTPKKRDSGVRDLARDLWVDGQATVAEVCQVCEITPTTLRRWRDHFGWDDERRMRGKGWGVVMAQVQKSLVEISEKLGKSKNPDADTIKLMGKLIPQALQLRQLDQRIEWKRLALRFTRGMTNHLRKRDPDALAQVLPYLKEFTVEIAHGRY